MDLSCGGDNKPVYVEPSGLTLIKHLMALVQRIDGCIDYPVAALEALAALEKAIP